jgi:hypothetical protein
MTTGLTNPDGHQRETSAVVRLPAPLVGCAQASQRRPASPSSLILVVPSIRNATSAQAHVHTVPREPRWPLFTLFPPVTIPRPR